MTKGWTTKADLRYKIKELCLESVVQEKRDAQNRAHLESQYELAKLKAVEDLRAELAKERLDYKAERAGMSAKIEQLEKRIAESPYEKLSEILKALVVKLPTLNVSSLNVETKGGK